MKISVVIPTHKRPAILSRAIDSVLNQTFHDYEIIVISDGYDKDTDIAMLKYEDNDKVNYYSYEKARGGNYARNLGISKSHGKYIAFLDDDDIWMENKLEKQIKIFKTDPNIGLVYTGHKQVYVGSKIKIYYTPEKAGDLSNIIFEKNYIGSTSSVIVKKELLKKVGHFDENLHAMQDYDLWIRICQKTMVGVAPEPLLLYYNDFSKKQISSQVEKQIKAKEYIELKYRDYYKTHPQALNMLDKLLFKTIIKITKRNNNIEETIKASKRYVKKYPELNTRLYVNIFKLPYKVILSLESISRRIGRLGR